MIPFREKSVWLERRVVETELTLQALCSRRAAATVSVAALGTPCYFPFASKSRISGAAIRLPRHVSKKAS